MHPDVPRWAQDVLERELTDVSFLDFVVLKDGSVQKLAIGHTPRETFVVQKTPAGGEIYRVTDPAARVHSGPDVNGGGHARRESAPHPRGAADAPEVTCPACATTFRYWRQESAARPVYCFNCGAAVRNGEAPHGPAREVEEHAAHA